MTKIASAVRGVARLMDRRHISGLMVMVLFGSLLSIGACSSNNDQVTFPTPPPPESRMWLFDVYGTAADDVYVGGARGVMYHFDGADWNLQDLGSSAAITTIWSPPAGTPLYAVGHGGHIWRNSGSGWSGMSSGTQQDLYGIGQILTGPAESDLRIEAVGANGTIRQFNGSSWGGVPDGMAILDENFTEIATLSVAKDLSSVLTVNRYFLGGAFYDPNFTGPRFGTDGTKGNVMAFSTYPDTVTTADWILRPISGEQRVEAEWVLCTSSDADSLGWNYLGTSEGWLFRLSVDADGRRVWRSFFPDITFDPGAGIRDIWVAPDGNVYLVTDEGSVIYQTVDYDFAKGTGSREILFDSNSSLVSIWGTGPDNIYFTGYVDEKIFHGVHDVAGGTFTVETIDLPFPDKAGSGSLLADVNEIGRPLQQ